MPDTNTQINTNPKARMDVDDQVSTRFDDGSSITIMRTTEHYRVTHLDLWARPIREPRNFPGNAHAQEREAREYAARLYQEHYTGGPVTWVVYRAMTSTEHTTIHNPDPEPTRQLQLI